MYIDVRFKVLKSTISIFCYLTYVIVLKRMAWLIKIIRLCKTNEYIYVRARSTHFIEIVRITVSSLHVRRHVLTLVIVWHLITASR